ncbi:MAG: THUMP domain-containing class I SAM-dependent RNA methyltransferase [Pseudobdellovibrionaceae bacterium]
MAEFFATTARGLVEPLQKELASMGLSVGPVQVGGVAFESNWEGCYKANFNSRLASRILKPILDFVAYQPEDLYHNILKHDFTKYIRPDQTLSIEASVKESKMRDQRFIAMKIKDAIVDQFTEKFGSRPNVENVNPDLRVHVKAYKNQFSVALDTSGQSLFMRGYRQEATEAPLKENLAAGLLQLAEWDQQSPVVDLMCGSGTFLIEAAMMAAKIAPGQFRKKFAFQNWKGFDPDVFSKVVDEGLSEEKTELPFKFYGFDIDRQAIDVSKANARRAGVDELIEFKREPVSTVKAPVEKGMIILNPPYGARIGDEDNLRDVYKDLGFTLKTQFKGWDCWILSGNKDLIMDLKLKSTRKIFVFNGQIECRFLKYSVNA